MTKRLYPCASFLTLALFLAWGGCTTTQVAPPSVVIPPDPPSYVKVPHPDGMDSGDLLAIFTTDKAPALDSLKTCDADYMKLREKTQSPEELEQGAREFVRMEPVKWHWCYYGKLYLLDAELKDESYIQEKQKKVTQTYLFVTPFSRAFMREYQDSRYLRIAINRYRRYSETVFFRKVETTPETTANLAGVENPWGNYRPSKNRAYEGVLEKYGIVKPEDVVAKENKVPADAVFPFQAEEERKPAAEASPAPQASPQQVPAPQAAKPGVVVDTLPAAPVDELPEVPNIESQ